MPWVVLVAGGNTVAIGAVEQIAFSAVINVFEDLDTAAGGCDGFEQTAGVVAVIDLIAIGEGVPGENREFATNGAN